MNKCSLSYLRGLEIAELKEEDSSYPTPTDFLQTKKPHISVKL